LYSLEEEKNSLLLRKLTQDDSYINEVLRLQVNDRVLTENEAEEIRQVLSEVDGPEAFPKHLQAWKWLWYHRNKITKDIDAQGKSTPTIHTEKLSSSVRKLLVVSDGISDNLPESELLRIVQNNFLKTVGVVVSAAKAIATGENPQYKNRAKPDDISCAALAIDE